MCGGLETKMGKKVYQDQSEQPEHLLKYIAEAGTITSMHRALGWIPNTAVNLVG